MQIVNLECAKDGSITANTSGISNEDVVVHVDPQI